MDEKYLIQIWEITGDASLYLTSERYKQQSADKSARIKLSQKVKIIDKIICAIDKLKHEKDICKIEDEIKKYTSLIEKEEILKQKELQKYLEKLEKDKIEQGKAIVRE